MNDTIKDKELNTKNSKIESIISNKMYSTFELASNVLTDKSFSLHNPFMIHFLCPFFNL